MWERSKRIFIPNSIFLEDNGNAVLLKTTYYIGDPGKLYKVACASNKRLSGDEETLLLSLMNFD